MAKKIGELLVEAGVLDPHQLQSALGRQRRFGGRLGTNLIAMQFLDERAVAQGLSRQQGVPFVVLSCSAIPLQLLEHMPLEVARKNAALPVHLDERELFAAMADPRSLAIKDEIRFVTGKRVHEHGAVHGLLLDAIEEAYRLRDLGNERFWQGMDLDPSIELGEAGHLEIVVGRDEGAPAQPPPGPVEIELDSSWVDEMARGSQDGSSRKRVLVVDDEAGIRSMLSLYFDKNGYEVIEAADGATALQHLQAQPPDVIVLDAMLPGVHGFDICFQVKHAQATRHIPVIMISAVYRGWRYADDVRKKYGADAFLEKPLRLDELKHTIEQALARAGQAPAPEELCDRAKAALQKAAGMFHQGDIMGAIHELSAAVEAAPFAASLHYRLGLLYEKLDEAYRAIASLERAAELDPAEEHLLALARLYETTGFDHKAYEAWERCLRKNPDSAHAAKIREHMQRLLP
ncbi:MAG: response regulator [Deltaproteobacteria bacterium]|nr:response regulator [Deltaproteobacteria bacterium]